jgi:predicted nuclease with TOPRIM domain
MQQRIRSRLEELKAEAAAGERRLAELEAENAQLRATLLRIDGAILALTELLDESEPAADDSEPPRPRAVQPTRAASPGG